MKNELSKKELLVSVNKYQDALIKIHSVILGKKSTIGFSNTVNEIEKIIEDTGIILCGYCSSFILRGEKTEKVNCFRYHANCFGKLKLESQDYKQFKSEFQILDKKDLMKKSSEAKEIVV